MEIPNPCLFSSWIVLIALVIGATASVYVFYLHSYEKSEEGLSATVFRLEGITDDNYGRAWDAVDVLDHSVEEGNAFFVITRQIRTFSQIQRRCSRNKAWCEGSSRYSKITGVKNFIATIKNRLYFPDNDRTESNGRQTTYDCLYNRDSNPHCARFELGYIVNEALKNEGSQQTFDDIVITGAVIAIRILWDCKFYLKTDCNPEYKFKRLDRVGSDWDPGYSLQSSHKYWNSSSRRMERDLIDSRGILFKIQVNAIGKKVGVIETLVLLLACFGFVTYVKMVIDFLLRYFNNRIRSEATKLGRGGCFGCRERSKDTDEMNAEQETMVFERNAQKVEVKAW